MFLGVLSPALPWPHFLEFLILFFLAELDIRFEPGTSVVNMQVILNTD